MSAYVSPPSYAKSVANVSDSRSLLMSSNGRTTNQKAETRIIHGSFFSGVVFAAALAFCNLGASTSASHNNLNTIKPMSTPVINRNDSDEDDDNYVYEADCLQELFGLNTAQWAKILKVERKTIYNWRKSPETKLKASAAERIRVLQAFAKEFNPKHSDFFSKFIFGRMADVNLMKAFFSEPLVLDELLTQYDNIYAKLDGMVKRKILLGA